MKEVSLNRVAGPYDKVPFENYIQSPIGLVPKAGKEQTRLIFHLSYEFGEGEHNQSLNGTTPREICSVTYNDIDHAVRSILIIKQQGESNSEHEHEPVVVYFGKSDIKSAFCLLGLNSRSWPWLVMIAQQPSTGKWYFFVDKCLPFGASISCSHFQRVSNALKHIVQVKTGHPLTNYLDDFLFFALTVARCNYLLNRFLEICQQLGFPIAEDKTEWATQVIIFLGILLDGKHFVLSIPLEKRERAIQLLRLMIDRRPPSSMWIFEFFV